MWDGGKSHYCILIILYNYSYMIGHCNFMLFFYFFDRTTLFLLVVDGPKKKWKSLNKFYPASIIRTKDAGHGDEGV